MPKNAADWPAQSASSEWDMVIVPQSVFERINVHPQIRIDYEQRELSALEEQLRTAENPLTKKMIEAASNGRPTNWPSCRKPKTKTPASPLNKPAVTTCSSTKPTTTRTKPGCRRSANSAARQGRTKPPIWTSNWMVLRARRRDEAVAAGTPPAEVVERVATSPPAPPSPTASASLYVMQSYLRPDLLTDSAAPPTSTTGDTPSPPRSAPWKPTRPAPACTR